MSVVRIGATKKYSDNWDNIFSGGRSIVCQEVRRQAGQEIAQERRRKQQRKPLPKNEQAARNASQASRK